MSEREVLIRILFRQKRRWFSSLMETLLSSSLSIIDANITTFDGNTLAVLVAEVSKINHLIIYIINCYSIYNHLLGPSTRSAVWIAVFGVSHDVLVGVKAKACSSC